MFKNIIHVNFVYTSFIERIRKRIKVMYDISMVSI